MKTAKTEIPAKNQTPALMILEVFHPDTNKLMGYEVLRYSETAKNWIGSHYSYKFSEVTDWLRRYHPTWEIPVRLYGAVTKPGLIPSVRVLAENKEAATLKIKEEMSRPDRARIAEKWQAAGCMVEEVENA